MKKMYRYRIEHKIKTLAQCWDPFEYKGFDFKHWDFTIQDGCKGKAWVVNKEIQAENVVDAINKFRNDLKPIIARVGYVSQCYTTMEWQPWIAVKLDNNNEKNFLCFHSKEEAPVGLHFDHDQLESLKKLEAFDDKIFVYLNESNLAGTNLTNTAMLIVALEGLAGEKTIEDACPHCGKLTGKRESLNKDKAKEIVQDSALYKSIFEYGTGIRNLLFHGKISDPISLARHKNANELLLRKMNKYFNTVAGTTIDPQEEIVHPQRHFLGNFSSSYKWFSQLDQGSDISLRGVMEDFDDNGNLPIEKYIPIRADDRFVRSY